MAYPVQQWIGFAGDFGLGCKVFAHRLPVMFHPFWFSFKQILCLLWVSFDLFLRASSVLLTMQLSFSFVHTYSDSLNQGIHSMIHGGQGLWRTFFVCGGLYGGHLGMALSSGCKGGYLGLTILAPNPCFPPCSAPIFYPILPDPLFFLQKRFEISSFFTIGVCRQDRDFCCAKMLFTGTPLALRAPSVTRLEPFRPLFYVTCYILSDAYAICHSFYGILRLGLR